MQIPTLLYGTLTDIQERCATASMAFQRGQPWLDAFEAEGCIATEEYPGLLVVGGNTMWVSNEKHYRFDLPLAGVTEKWMPDDYSSPAADALFASLMERPWTLLCLLSPDSPLGWFIKGGRSERTRLFLRAALCYWDLLAAEGRRYCWGFEAEELWESPTMVTYILVGHGAPRDLLIEPLLRDGLRPLLHLIEREASGNLSPMLQDFIGEMDHLPSVPARTDFTPERHCHPDRVESYGNGPGDNPADGLASTSLINAMDANDEMAVRRLIEEGADVNTFDVGNVRYPLVWAIEQGHTDLVRFMLEHGAAIDSQSEEGTSPLMVAVFRGNPTMVRLLLEHGADPTYRTDEGWDAVGCAELGEHDEIAMLIREAQNHYGDTSTSE